MTDLPIVVFPIGYMYHIELFHIERLYRSIGCSIRDQSVYEWSKTWEIKFNAKNAMYWKWKKKCNETLMDV